MNKWVEILVGLILIVGTILVALYSQGGTLFGKSLNLWHAAWEFLKGGVVWMLIGIGLLFLMLGISDLKE